MIDKQTRAFLDGQRLAYVATVSAENTPNLSPKGTVIVWDSETLAFADIRSPNTVANISANPNVAINIVDPLSRKGFRFSGTAKIVRDGPEFASALERYKKMGIKSRINALVLVRISAVSSVTSPLYDLGFSEDQVRLMWRDRLLGA